VTGNLLFTAISGSPVSISKVDGNTHTEGSLLFSAGITGAGFITKTFEVGEIVMTEGDRLSFSVSGNSNGASAIVSWKEDV